MHEITEPEIVGSERLDNGIVVTFKDGRSLFYPAALLDAISSRATDQTNVDYNGSLVTRV